MDATPKYDAQFISALRSDCGTYKDQHYVAREVAALALQLKDKEVEGLRKAWITFRNIVTYPYVFVANTRMVQRVRRRIIFRQMRRALPKLQAMIKENTNEKA